MKTDAGYTGYKLAQSQLRMWEKAEGIPEAMEFAHGIAVAVAEWMMDINSKPVPEQPLSEIPTDIAN